MGNRRVHEMGGAAGRQNGQGSCSATGCRNQGGLMLAGHPSGTATAGRRSCWFYGAAAPAPCRARINNCDDLLSDASPYSRTIHGSIELDGRAMETQTLISLS